MLGKTFQVETNFFEADGPVTYPPELKKFENRKTLKVDVLATVGSNDRTPSSSTRNNNEVDVERPRSFKNPAVASKTIRISLSSGPRSDAQNSEKSQPQIQLISTVSSNVPATNPVTSSPVDQTASDLSGTHSVGSSLASLKPFSCQWANCTESFDTAREFTLHVIQHTQESVQNQTSSVTSPLSSSPNRLLSQVAFNPDESDVSPQASSQLVLLSAAPSPSVAVNGDGRVTTQIHSNSPPFIPENRAIIQTVDGLLISFHSPGYYIIEGQNSPPYFSSVDDLFAMGLTLNQINAITPPEHRPRYVVEQVISPAESLELLEPQDSITRTVEGNSQAQQKDHSSNERQLIQYETRPQPQQS
ncbi:hypothetical protein BKA69DRAFT_293626 [Paraphysoderma sedebokerense]|nr:hypothetical protein BKA69DRAFT_293626 [Paraphysoderma sedebokerense]